MMTSFSTLIMDFESGEDRGARLETLIDKARRWCFLVFSNPPPSDVSSGPRDRVHLAHHNSYDLVKMNSMATMKGENGEPVRWNWLTTEGNKTETMSYLSILPICWNDDPTIYTRRDCWMRIEHQGSSPSRLLGQSRLGVRSWKES